jgi:hypothetical protein
VRSSKLAVFTVAGFSASLNTAVTAAAGLTPVEPDAGNRDVMVGAVVSMAPGEKTTSTQ